jgi:hypothetical protein
MAFFFEVLQVLFTPVMSAILDRRRAHKMYFKYSVILSVYSCEGAGGG